MVQSETVPWRRLLAAIGAMLAVFLLAGAWRMLSSHGVFTTVTPGFSGSCRAVPGVSGAEDIVVDRADKIAFLSATDRRAKRAGKPSAADGIYSYSYAKPGARPVRLTGTPANFHPHGLSLYRAPDGSLTLYVINHGAAHENSVAVFSVIVRDGQVSLKETAIATSGLLVSPNDVAAVDDMRYYVVNDHAVKSDAGRWFDDNLVLPRTNILYFDGMKFRVAAKGLNFPSGVAVSQDRRHVYVAETYARKLVTFERDMLTGKLKKVNDFPIPSGLDNIHIAADGSLWIASHPKAYALSDFKHDAAKPAPSVVYRVTLKDGIPVLVDQVFADAGTRIGASSVAASADGHLLIGGAYETKILDCNLK